MAALGIDYARLPLATTPEHRVFADAEEFSEADAATLAAFQDPRPPSRPSRSSSAGSLPFYSLPPPPPRTPTPPGVLRAATPPSYVKPALAPLPATAAEVNPLRRRVESCLLQRERTVAQLTSWLRTAYRVQENVGASYGYGGLSRSGSSGSLPGGGMRRWNTMSATTRDDHRVKAAVFLAALRMQTCEVVEALDEWRKSRPPLKVATGGGKTLAMPRPFVWRGRWWPLQLALDPPLLPLPLATDPLLLRWFDRHAGDASLWCTPEGVAPPELYAAGAWHPPAVLARMHAADARLREELALLDLRDYELLRQRHAPSSAAAPGGGGGGGTMGGPAAASSVQLPGRFQPSSASACEPTTVASYASSWTSDGASVQLARLLYGGPKPYTLAIKALCKAVEVARIEEDARQHRAATVLQSAARGRKERKEGKVAQKRNRAVRSFQQPTATGGENEGFGLNTSAALRKEAGGRFAGLQLHLDPTKPVREALRDALTKNSARVMDLFRDMDQDGNGTISKKEFGKAMRAMGVTCPKAELDGLFDDFDADKGGLLEARELGRVLRRGAGKDVQLAKELEAGAQGEIVLKAKNRIKIREHAKDGRSARGGLAPTIGNLKAAMAQDLFRVKDIMNALDKDQDGNCTKEEFRQVLPMLGFDVSQPQALDALFDSFDADASGSVDFEELNKLLRKTFEPDNINGEEDEARDQAAVKVQSLMRGRSIRRGLRAPGRASSPAGGGAAAEAPAAEHAPAPA